MQKTLEEGDLRQINEHRFVFTSERVFPQLFCFTTLGPILVNARASRIGP
jgi:hypothetical protein